MDSRYPTFDAFWPFYLSQHSNRTCRGLHFFGTSLALIWLIYCGICFRLSWIPIGFFFGYGPAWIGHFAFERNRPATFTYPRWSFLADFKMLFLFFTGKLDQELQRYSIQETKLKSGN
jgi:hypothetical protein